MPASSGLASWAPWFVVAESICSIRHPGQLDVLTDGRLQLTETVFAAGLEIEVMSPLRSGWRVRGCDSNWNRFTCAYKLDLNHCALDVGETCHCLRSKTKTLMLLWNSPETPGTRFCIVLLNQSASFAVVFHINPPEIESRKSGKPQLSSESARTTFRVRPTLRVSLKKPPRFPTH